MIDGVICSTSRTCVVVETPHPQFSPEYLEVLEAVQLGLEVDGLEMQSVSLLNRDGAGTSALYLIHIGTTARAA